MDAYCSHTSVDAFQDSFMFICTAAAQEWMMDGWVDGWMVPLMTAPDGCRAVPGCRSEASYLTVLHVENKRVTAIRSPRSDEFDGEDAK
jgi:hypothetical protein